MKLRVLILKLLYEFLQHQLGQYLKFEAPLTLDGEINGVKTIGEFVVKNNRISVSSPIARALIGKEEGDTVVVNIPSGTVEYEIDEVKHI